MNLANQAGRKSIQNRAAVFLDRDGVVNETIMDGGVARPPRDIAELKVGTGVAKALSSLHAAGFLLLVISNQPDIARRVVSRDSVEDINRLLSEKLPIDAFYFCPHDNSDNCECRKPRPGLILEAARTWNVDLARSCLIGDRWVDISAAIAAGVDGILLAKEYSWNRSNVRFPSADVEPLYTGHSLEDCVDFILTAPQYG